jgi:beta-glucosidase
VANNIEENRFNSNSLMDDQTLREVYANIYKMIIQDGGVASIMAAYNSLNGTKCTENKHVLTEILRDDFGFLGFVMSDWWAMTNGTSTDKWQGDYEQAAVNGLNAGLDLEMGWALNYAQIENAVSNGNLTTDTVKTAAKRVLLQKKRFNVHDPNEQNPGLAAPPVSYDSTTGSITGNDDHIALAKKAALESMVLLKNSNGTLPIDTATVSKIAVIGANVSFSIDSEDKKYGGTIDFARDNHTGDLGSSRVWDDPAKGVGPYDGIKNAVGADAEVVVGNTASAAGDADVVVVVAGLTPQDEGEEYTGAGDRSSFALDAKISGTPQTDLINDVIALGKPVIVVLVGGSVIDMPWKDSVDAIVMSWYSGMVGGSALGELLTGQANFSGKLPFTWAAWNSYPDFNPGVTVKMDYYTGYRYFDQNNLTPDYPFGYGLSYSTYEYGDVTLTSETAGEDDVVTALVDITNSSDVDGTEVVMLFASYPDTAARRSAKELKGFERVDVPAGATVTAKVPFRIKDLKYYDETQSAWVLEKGTVNIGVGSSAENLQGAVSLTIQ